MPFVKGQSGNPAGKPKGAKSFTNKVRDALMKLADGKATTYEEELIRSILKNGIEKGDPTTQKLIWNYFDGMPSQPIDHTTQGEKIESGIDDAKFEQLMESYANRRAKKADTQKDI